MGSNPTSSALERWVSGLNQQFAKLSYWKTGTGGSNPPLSEDCARSSVWIEHQIADLGVRGSSPLGRVAFFGLDSNLSHGKVAELV